MLFAQRANLASRIFPCATGESPALPAPKARR